MVTVVVMSGREGVVTGVDVRWRGSGDCGVASLCYLLCDCSKCVWVWQHSCTKCLEGRDTSANGAAGF